MARAQVPHGKVPFPSMGHVFWVPLLLTAVLVPTTRSQTVNISGPYFRYQRQNGELAFAVHCSIKPWYQQHNLNPETCSFKLETLEKASRIVDTNETGKLFVVEQTSSSTCFTGFWLEDAWMGKNLRLQCLTCAKTRDNTRRPKNTQRTPECETAWKEAEITLNPEEMRAEFRRYAQITSEMTQPQQGPHPGRIDATLGTNLTLLCRVRNLRTLGDHVCEWLFWPQNYQTSGVVRINQTTLNSQDLVYRLGAGRLSISSKSDDNFCNLVIRGTQLEHQGNWSCAPGRGKDGWILSSFKVEMIVGVPTTTSQSRVAISGPYFTYQWENGTLEFDVQCQIEPENKQHKLNPRTCSFEVMTPRAFGIVGAHEAEKLSKTVETSFPLCTAKVLLEQESISANQEQDPGKSIGSVTALPNNGPISFSIHSATIRENLQLKCFWNYTICAEGGGNNVSPCTEEYEEAGITLEPKKMLENFTRSAEIQTNMTRPQDGSQPRIDAIFGKDLNLHCQVRNIGILGNRVCQWQFRPQQNYPQSPAAVHISWTTLNSPSVVDLFGAGRLSISSTSGDNCDLNIRQTRLTDQGYWSCAPSQRHDGWISSSPEVELRLGSACSTHTECPQEGNQQLVCQTSALSPIRNAGAELKSCIHPCDSKRGQEVCQGLPNTVCKYHQSGQDFVRCGCKTPYVSVGTEFPKNNPIRCSKQCTVDAQCMSNETCVPGNATGSRICLPTCEVHPCGQNATCKPHVRSEVFDQRCICNNGTYAVNNSGNHVEAKGCMAPRFGGLSMLVISADNGETQACNLTENMETESCSFSAFEGDNITFICFATQIFPQPQELHIFGNHNDESSVSLEGADPTSSAEPNQEPNPVRDYKIAARLLNAMKVIHDNAAFECHFTSEAKESEVRVTLTVRQQQADPNSNGHDTSKSVTSMQDAMGVISILLITLAVVLLVVNLVFIFVRRKWKNQRHQSPNDRESHNATVPMTSVITDVAGTRSDTIYTNATSVMSAAEASNTKVSEKRDSNKEEPIYEDINDKGLSTAFDRAGRQENKYIGLGQPVNKPSRFPMDTAMAALGDSELPPNILPPKHVQHTNLARIHLGVGDARNEEPGTSAGSLQSTTATSSHAEKLQNDLSGQSTSTNAPLAPELDSAYAIVVG